MSLGRFYTVSVPGCLAPDILRSVPAGVESADVRCVNHHLSAMSLLSSLVEEREVRTRYQVLVILL
jgi:hypothetical protein